MQTCSKCNHNSPDSESNCVNCGVDLMVFSTHAVLLKKIIENPRVSAIRVSVAKDACTTCRAVEGVYAKENVPTLPVEGCSNAKGCNCAYAPILEEVYP